MGCTQLLVGIVCGVHTILGGYNVWGAHNTCGYNVWGVNRSWWVGIVCGVHTTLGGYSVWGVHNTCQVGGVHNSWWV